MAGGNAGLHDIHVIAHQNQIEFGCFGNQFGLCGKSGCITRYIFQSNKFGSEIQADTFILKCIEHFQFGLEIRIGDVRFGQRGINGFIEKCFFMTIQNRFTAGYGGAYTFTDCDRSNWRCGRLCQFLPGVIRYIRTTVQFGLAGCQVHGKGQTGRYPTLLAVGLGQEFENLNTG